MKFVDILGQEIKVGHYVAISTVRGLKRSLVKKISILKEERWHNKDFDYFLLELKSITVGKRFKREKDKSWMGKYIPAVITGNSRQLRFVKKDEENAILQFEVVYLGTFEQAYTPDNQAFIKSTKTKI